MRATGSGQAKRATSGRGRFVAGTRADRASTGRRCGSVGSESGSRHRRPWTEGMCGHRRFLWADCRSCPGPPVYRLALPGACFGDASAWRLTPPLMSSGGAAANTLGVSHKPQARGMRRWCGHLAGDSRRAPPSSWRARGGVSFGSLRSGSLRGGSLALRAEPRSCRASWSCCGSERRRDGRVGSAPGDGTGSAPQALGESGTSGRVGNTG